MTLSSTESIEQALQRASRLHESGSLAEAEAVYSQILQREPRNLAALYNLGVLTVQSGRATDAMAIFRGLIALNPKEPSYYRGLASACRLAARHSEAIQALNAALSAAPNDDVTHRDLALTLCSMGRHAEGVVEYHRTIELRNARRADESGPAERLMGAQIWLNLGVSLHALGRIDQAIAANERAVALQPDYARARMNLGYMYFKQGDLPRGFAGYEARWKTDDFADPWPDCPQPVWDGSDLQGRTVLLWYEQGFGDMIQFVRYASLVPVRNGKAIILCQPQLKRLLKQLEKLGVEVVAKGEQVEFDLHLPLMSLPRVFDTTRQTVPFREGYLKAEPELVAKWKERMDQQARAAAPRLRIGLVWAGSPGFRNDTARSTTLAAMRPFLEVTGVRFYSLQKGEAAAAQLRELAGQLSITDWTADLNDFTDTAALIANLDLVIAVDTGVAHLAAALGKEVWLMIAHEPDFRWLADDQRTCWYASERLFRQPQPGNWGAVIQEVAGELRKKLEVTAPPRPLPYLATTSADSATVEMLNLAQEHHTAARLTEAEALYRKVLAKDPENPQALHYLAIIAQQCGQSEVALQMMKRSVELAPSTSFLKNLASLYRAMGKPHEAIAALGEVVGSEPNDAHAHFSLALALSQERRFEESLLEYRRAVVLQEKTPVPTEPAERQFRARLYTSQASTLGEVGRYDEAILSCNQALDLVPDYALAHQNRGYCYFCKGDLPRGFEDYEWRWKCEGFPDKWPSYSRPAWDGSDLTGRTILLWHEQGLGDTIHFARYAPLVAQRGGKVVILCQQTLKRMLKSLESERIRIIGDDEPLPDFDLHFPLMSLPRVFQTTRETVPFAAGYLRPEHAQVTGVAARMAKETRPGTMRIGLVWAGSPLNTNDANRSILLEALVPILRVPGIHFFSLQKGEPAAQLGKLTARVPGIQITDWTAELHDFADTAALIANLDLVISVDTAVVHVAGAIGKEVWALLPFKADFRWAADRDQSSWYKSARLFRQDRPGAWDGVFNRVVAALHQRLGIANRIETSSIPALSPQLHTALRQAHEHHSAGRLDLAERLYREVLAGAPDHPDALHHLGLIAFQCGQYPPAIELMSRSVALDKNQPFFLKNLAAACRAAGKLDEAARWLGEALVLAPAEPAVHEELAIVLEKLDRLEESVAEHRLALAGMTRVDAANPAQRGFEAKAQMNLGAALERLGRFEEAMPHFERAIALMPDYALAHTHRANVLFRRRDLPAAWEEYEWRFRCKGFPTPGRNYAQPVWDGSALNGRTILLWPEQGLGDLIQFARFVPAVAQRGGRVVLQCMPELKRLLQPLPGDAQIVTTEDSLPPFDTHLPLISVPKVLGTNYDTIPHAAQYLHANPELSAQWAKRLGNRGGKLRVGLVWSGSASFAANARRSIPLQKLLPLAKVPGIEWHSLQIGEPVPQISSMAQEFAMVDHSNDIRDFADTAAILDNLDLLISTDTAVVHLAGAMGKETWAMLWSERDFRWLMDDETTRWYPSSRIFLQKRIGEWTEVVDRVRQALLARAATAEQDMSS